MIIVAESGSTKTEWVILDKEGQVVNTVKTQGYNPYFHDAEFVRDDLGKSELIRFKNDVTQIYFYGAGCSSPELNTKIRSGLEAVFSSASVVVDHDLLAAAYSVYCSKPVIAAILGTGSNSVYFDGKEITEARRALGFILGDEGSGCYFGKQLVRDYFYDRLPGHIANDFRDNYGLEWGQVVNQVYGNIHANVYLASFMPFIAEHRESFYVESMIRKGFAAFINTHLRSHSHIVDTEIGFVGSVAFYFKDLLEDELRKEGLQVARVIQKPVDRLVDYHVRHVFPMITV